MTSNDPAPRLNIGLALSLVFGWLHQLREEPLEQVVRVISSGFMDHS
jgi:hypothetical protein